MELVGIILSVPVAFVANLVYSYLLARFVVRVDWLRKIMWVASVALLVLFAAEIALLVTIGPVRSRASIGPAFYLTHLAIFLLGTPALANVLILRFRSTTFRWYWAVPLCTLFALVLVLLQYGVSEALYGIDGGL